MFNKPIFTYIGFFLCVVAITLGVLKPDLANTAWTFAAFFGFGSAALGRKFIDSKGWLTYTIGAVVGLLVVAQIAGFITPEHFQGLMIAFAPLTGISYAKALANSPSMTSFPTNPFKKAA